MIKVNEGHLDRGARLVLGVLLGTLVLTGSVAPSLAGLATAASVTLFGTTALGFCPLWAVLGIDTRAEEPARARVAPVDVRTGR